MKLTDRELATVLAALRNWQNEIDENPEILSANYGHFEDVQPLNAEEINELCEKLNRKD